MIKDNRQNEGRNLLIEIAKELVSTDVVVECLYPIHRRLSRGVFEASRETLPEMHHHNELPTKNNHNKVPAKKRMIRISKCNETPCHQQEPLIPLYVFV
jgi:hypothetical protein